MFGRYRPVGVARVGSAEDRVQAYRRFLDAAQQCGSTAIWYAGMAPVLIKSYQVGEPWARELSFRLMESKNEMASALDAVRLCGPNYVIAAAENVGKALLDPGIGDVPEQLEKGMAPYRIAIHNFLEAARKDLAHNPRWWQFLWKRKERRFLQRVSSRASHGSGELQSPEQQCRR